MSNLRQDVSIRMLNERAANTCQATLVSKCSNWLPEHEESDAGQEAAFRTQRFPPCSERRGACRYDLRLRDDCSSSAGAQSFTTIELKSNHLGTVKDGSIACIATAQHLGRNTQVWDAVVTDEVTGRKIALFRCTQMILWPKA
jgi:hypothetical protein